MYSSQSMLRQLLILSLFLLLPLISYAEGETYYINNISYSSKELLQPGDDMKSVGPSDGYAHRYTDYSNGFSLAVPADMAIDFSLSSVCTTFTGSTWQLQVLYDNFSHTPATAADYTEYGSRFLRQSSDMHITTNTTITVDGYPARYTQWERAKLQRVPADRNYYACVEIIKNDNEVYTLFFKSSEPLSSLSSIIDSVSLFQPAGGARNYPRIQNSRTAMNKETRAFFDRYFSPDSPQHFGIFEPAAPERFDSLDELEKRMDYKFPVIIRYQTVDEPLPLYGLTNAYEKGKVVELTLQTVHNESADALKPGGVELANHRVLFDILDGKYDEYFHRYAETLKQFGHPVLLRLNNEMNGDWCWYSAFYTGKDAEMYKASWRYIYQIFESHGVDNVIWVWNPHDLSFPNFKWNHHMMYYPGDEYVDIIGLTGYNTGTYFPGEKWREFDQIYPALCNEYGQLFLKPFMITEFASNSVGGNKPAWIENMFKQLPLLPQIKMAVWWSGVDYDSNGWPGRVYKIDESEEILNVFQTHLKKFAK